jgi:hypothetical protein
MIIGEGPEGGGVERIKCTTATLPMTRDVASWSIMFLKKLFVSMKWLVRIFVPRHTPKT